MTTKKYPEIKSINDLVCKNSFGTYFGVPQKIFDDVWRSLTEPQGNSVVYISMEIGADPDVFHPLKDFLCKYNLKNDTDDDRILHFLDTYLNGPGKIPNYSGGLGVLAGDTLKSFADNHIPVVAVSLLYCEGYFSQIVDSKVGQIDQATRWNPGKTPTLFQLHDPDKPQQPLEINVPFFNKNDDTANVQAQVWMKMEVNKDLDYFVPEFLLDYSLPSSPSWILEAAGQLYKAKSTIIKAYQRQLLGAGVIPLMQRLGLTANTLHLNEQHGVAVTLRLILHELKNRLGPKGRNTLTDEDILAAARKVARHIVYTIHTPVKAGHDRFDREIYSRITQKNCRRILNLLARDMETPNEYNFTALAMRVNRAVNSVSRLHRDVTRQQFPEFADKINAITNGVHHLTWISDNRAQIFDAHKNLSDWRNDPGCFTRADLADSATFRNNLTRAWQDDNRQLVQYVNTMFMEHRKQMVETWIDPPNYLSCLPEGGTLEPGVFTIGFARRFSTYKRADLIFDNLPALADLLLRGGWRINFVFAGKAHPADEPGKYILKLILDCQKELYIRSKGLAKLVFIPGYDMQIAKMMVSGVHAWLNSPKRPLEASGTSGMKAAMNGVPNISVMDGWWVEGYHNGRTGWKFGFEGPVEEANMSESPDSLFYKEDSRSFYQLLPRILRMFYDRPDRYLDKAINNLRLNMPIFNTHRMAAEYVWTYGLKLDDATADRMAAFRKLYQSDMKNEKN